MAEFLNSDAIFAELLKIIKEAKETLLLVSPYISLKPEQEKQLRNAAERGVKITIVYRTPDPRYEDVRGRTDFIDPIMDLPGLRILECLDLHAKIYANENKAILTSRNLNERNSGYSIEVGVLYEKNQDRDIYNELFSAAKEISEYSGCIFVVDNARRRNKRLERNNTELGYCVRCKKRIPLSMNIPLKSFKLKDIPLCPSCGKRWNQYEDPTYLEKYCHFCGRRADNISVEKPIEPDCYSEYRDFVRGLNSRNY